MDRRGFIAGAALATLAVAGCSSSKKEAGSGTASIAPDTSAELVLAYWDKNQTRTIKENIKSFNKKYPNVRSPRIWLDMRTTGRNCAPRRREMNCPMFSG